MKRKATTIVFIASGIIGCSSSDFENYRLFPDQYASNVKYNSIYYYGYNQGCESALSSKVQDDMDYMKDETLDNSDTQFNEGWDAGYEACKDGVQRIMPSLVILATNAETEY